MSKFKIHYASFYITNVCNLTCPNCNSYNDRKIKGSWDFDIELYRPWAEVLDMGKTSVIGGEPTLNPRLSQWIRGVHSLWPHVPGEVISNGTYISRSAELVDALAETGWTLAIRLHRQEHREYVLNELEKTFGYLEPIKESINPDTRQSMNLEFISDEGVRINVANVQWFHQNAFKDEAWEFHDSVPDKAHAVCGIKGCHNFRNGLLYKCPMVMITPDLLTQNQRPVPELLSRYQPLGLSDLNQEILDSLTDNPIPQCKLCPEELIWKPNLANFKNRIINLKVLNHHF